MKEKKGWEKMTAGVRKFFKGMEEDKRKSAEKWKQVFINLPPTKPVHLTTSEYLANLAKVKGVS